MRTHNLLLTYITLVTFVGVRAAHAQPINEPEPSEAEAPASASTESPAPAVDIVEATWTARREYQRQHRTVDLSELGSAAASISLGAYSLTRDAPFTRGLGGMTLAGGSIHLVSGIIYTIRSQRGVSPERAPDEFREGDPYARELEEAEHRQDLFLAVLSADASTITAGLTTALVGVQRDKPVVQGVGIALASQGVLTLLLDLSHQDQGRRYLRALRELNPALTVMPAPGGGATVTASLAWVR
jgi:hypothetical protein